MKVIQFRKKVQVQKDHRYLQKIRKKTHSDAMPEKRGEFLSELKKIKDADKSRNSIRKSQQKYFKMALLFNVIPEIPVRNKIA